MKWKIILYVMGVICFNNDVMANKDLHNGCIIPSPLDDRERSRMYGDAVGDSTSTNGDSLEYVITDKGVVVIRPRSTDYDGLTTGIPTRTGPRKAQEEETAPEPKAKK